MGPSGLPGGVPGGILGGADLGMEIRQNEKRGFRRISNGRLSNRGYLSWTIAALLLIFLPTLEAHLRRIQDDDSQSVLSRRLGMTAGDIGAIEVRNTYMVGEGGSNLEVGCLDTYCKSSSILAGGSFYIKLENGGGGDAFSALDGASLEEAHLGGCDSARENPVGKTAMGDAITTKFSSLRDSVTEMNPGLPLKSPLTSATAGRMSCFLKSTGDMTSCYLGCETDDCNETSNVSGSGVSIRRPGLYNLCVCLDGVDGANCANGSAGDFDVDLGVLVQVAGFAQDASYNVNDMCAAELNTCAYGYPCELTYDVGTDDSRTDVHTGIGIRTDGGDPGIVLGRDAIALMEPELACTEAGTILTASDMTTKFISEAQFLDDSDTDDVMGEKVGFDFSPLGAVSAAPGEYRACYCPGASYGSEEVGGLVCTDGVPEHFPFKAGKVTIRGPTENTFGPRICFIGQQCELLATDQHVTCHKGGDHIAIVGSGMDSSFPCGDAGQVVHGLTSMAAVNGAEFMNPANGTEEGMFMFGMPKGMAIQGEYNLCWCPKEHSECASPSALSEDFKVQIGTLTIPGAMTTSPKPCYYGRACHVSVSGAAPSSACFGCLPGDSLKVAQSKPKGFDGMGDLEFWEKSDFACGEEENATVVEYHDVSQPALDFDPTDLFQRFNYTFEKMTSPPAQDGISEIHHLCWASVAASASFDTLATLTSDFTVYGPHPDNYVTCSANSTDCSSISLGLRRHSALAANDEEDFLIAHSENCGEGNVALFNVSETSDMYTVFNQKTDGSAPIAPGQYNLCYCPSKVMVDDGFAEVEQDVDCSSLNEFKTFAGTFVIGGPAAEMAPGGEGVYKVHRDIPFDLELFGYELGADHKVKFVNSTQRCDIDSFNDTLDNYPADGASPLYVTSVAKLSNTEVLNISPSSSAEQVVVLEISDTTGLAAGSRIKFITSFGVVQSVNLHTLEKDSLFKTHQVSNGTPRADGIYEVAEVVNSTHFELFYPDVMPEEVMDIGTNTFQVVDREIYQKMIARELGDFNLCWAGSNVDFYQAGKLSVLEPLMLPSASIHLTSREVLKSCASVILFKTGGSGMVTPLLQSGTAQTVKSIYEDTMRILTLRVRFPDATKFKPLTAIFGGSAALTTDSTIDEEIEASLEACSKMFFEFGTSDLELNFPLPNKCWYQRNNTGTVVDLYVRFTRGNGLRSDTEYQLVLNTMLGSSASNVKDEDVQASVAILDDMDLHPNAAVEVGQAVYEPNGFNLTATNQGLGNNLGTTAIKFSSDNAIDNLLDFGSPLDGKSFKIEISPGGSQPVVGDYVEIYLNPLTSWDLKPTDVSLNALTGFGQSSNATIVTTSVIPGGRKNIIQIHLADNMTSAAHVVEISSAALAVPEGGFFPLVPAYTAQLLNGGDKNNKVYMGPIDFTGSVYFFKSPEIRAAHLVTNTDLANNHHQSRGEFNTLHAQIMLSAPLTFDGPAGDTHIKFSLPSTLDGGSYTCEGADLSVAVQDINSLSVLKFSDDQNMTPRLAPTGNGALPGSLTTGSNECILKLNSGVRIPKEASVFLRISVRNPPVGLKHSSMFNFWTVEIQQGKALFAPTVAPQKIFSILSAHPTDSRLGPNVSIAGVLPAENVLIAPLRTEKIGEENVLQIYFKTEQSTGLGGTLEILAPSAYSFPSDLTPSSIMATKTNLLPEIRSVVVAKSNFLSISFHTGLEAASHYVFAVRVVNPSELSEEVLVEEDWNLSTYENQCTYTDAGRANCDVVDRQTAAPHQKPKVHTQELPYFQMHILDSKYAANVPTKALLKFQLSEELKIGETLQLELPSAYVFSSPAVSTDMTVHMYDPTTVKFFDLNRTPAPWIASGVSADMNKLSFRDDVTRFNATSSQDVYYLEVSVVVPMMSSSFLSPPEPNVAFLISGETDNADTSSSIAYPFHIVAQVMNGKIEPDTYVTGELVKLTVAFEIFHEVPSEGCLVLTFPTALNFQKEEDCVLDPAPDNFYSSEHADLVCGYVLKASAAVNSVQIYAPKSLQKGRYQYTLPVINPDTSVSPTEMDTFHIESYFNSTVSFSDPTNIIDKAASIPSFSLANPLAYAASLNSLPTDFSASSKRGQDTYHAIGFEFSNDLFAPNADLTIIAPDGYHFASECYSDVYLGESSDDLTEFEDHRLLGENATLLSCAGEENHMQISLSSGEDLVSGVKYVLFVKTRNPIMAPHWNLWTLFASSQTATFAGPDLDFFEHLSIDYTSPSKGEMSLIQIEFTTSEMISGQGASLSLQLPSRFTPKELGNCGSSYLQEVETGKNFQTANFASNLEGVWNSTDFGSSDLGCFASDEQDGLLIIFAFPTEETKLEAITRYVAVFEVVNPPEESLAVLPPIHMWSCDDSETTLCSVGSVSDLATSTSRVGYYGRVDSYAIEEPLKVAPLIPDSTESLAETLVTLNITITDAAVGDKLVISSPQSFPICTPTYLSQAVHSVQLSSPTCDGGLQHAISTLLPNPETNSTVIPESLTITLALQNPVMSVPTAENMWVVRHIRMYFFAEDDPTRGPVHAAAHLNGWSIGTEIEDGMVEFVAGTSQAVGGISAARFSFTAAQEATLVRVSSSSAVDLSQTYPAEGSVVSQNATSCTFSATIKPGYTHVLLYGILNPSESTPNPTMWDFETLSLSQTVLDTARDLVGYSITHPLDVKLLEKDETQQYTESLFSFVISATPGTELEAGNIFGVQSPPDFEIKGLTYLGAHTIATSEGEETPPDGEETPPEGEEEIPPSSGGNPVNEYGLPTSVSASTRLVFRIEVMTPAVAPESLVFSFYTTNTREALAPSDLDTMYEISTRGSLSEMDLGVFHEKLKVAIEASSLLPGASDVSYAFYFEFIPPVVKSATTKKITIQPPEGYMLIAGDCAENVNSGEDNTTFATCTVTASEIILENYSGPLTEPLLLSNINVAHPVFVNPTNSDWIFALFDDTVLIRGLHSDEASLMLLEGAVAYQPIPTMESELLFLFTPMKTVEMGNIDIHVPSGYSLGVPRSVSTLGGEATYDTELLKIAMASLVGGTTYSLLFPVTSPSSDSEMPYWGLTIVDEGGEVIEISHNFMGPRTIAKAAHFEPMKLSFDNKTESPSTITLQFPVISPIETVSAPIKLTISGLAMAGLIPDPTACGLAVSEGITLDSQMPGTCGEDFAIFHIDSSKLPIGEHTFTLNASFPTEQEKGHSFLQVEIQQLDPPYFAGVIFNLENIHTAGSSSGTNNLPTHTFFLIIALLLSALLI